MTVHPNQYVLATINHEQHVGHPAYTTDDGRVVCVFPGAVENGRVGVLRAIARDELHLITEETARGLLCSAD